MIPGEIETARSHELARLVEKAVSDSADAAAAVVHVDPSGRSGLQPIHETAERTLREIIRAYSEIKRFDGLRVSPSQEGPMIEFRIVVDGKLSLEHAHTIGDHVVRDLRKTVGDCKVDFRIEPGKNGG